MGYSHDVPAGLCFSNGCTASGSEDTKRAGGQQTTRVTMLKAGAAMIFHSSSVGCVSNPSLLGYLPHRTAALVLAACTVALSIGSGTIGSCADRQSVPNIVVILADDLGRGEYSGLRHQRHSYAEHRSAVRARHDVRQLLCKFLRLLALASGSADRVLPRPRRRAGSHPARSGGLVGLSFGQRNRCCHAKCFGRQATTRRSSANGIWGSGRPARPPSGGSISSMDSLAT